MRSMLIILGSAVLSLAALGAGSLAQAQLIKPNGEEKPPVVLIERAIVTELSDLITYPARVTSKIKGSVYSLADGLVTHIFATLGTPVRACWIT